MSLTDQYNTSQPRSTLVPPRPVHQPTQIHPGPSQTSTPANPGPPWSLPDQYTSQPRSTLVPPRPVHQPTQIHPGPSQTSRPNFQRELDQLKSVAAGSIPQQQASSRPPGPINTSGPLSA
ncbi:unnamed protein product [Boreogadus saida]